MPTLPSNAAPSGPNQTDATDARPPKRSKLKKDISKIRKNIPRIFATLTAILSHAVYNKIELQILKDWLANTLSVRYNVPPPVPHPFPPLMILLQHLKMGLPLLFVETKGEISVGRIEVLFWKK